MPQATVYKPTAKGLAGGRFGSDLESTDRLIFTSSKSAICYHADTGEVIEPFMIKSKDCFVEAANDESIPKLYISPLLWRMYKNDNLIRSELRHLAIEHNIEIIEK